MIKKQHFLTWLSIITLTSTTAVSAQSIPTREGSLNQQESISIPIPIPVTPPENNQVTPNICKAELIPPMLNIIRRYGGGWGVLVQSLETGETIYHYNADKGFIPASNAKILTTAAAMQRMQPQTTVSANKSLQEWVTVTNLRSNNFYADTLLRRIGGSASAKQTLAQLGVNPRSFHLADGSGLSRNNIATPRALVDTLRVMYADPNRDLFLSSLPTAGVSGTLTNRMRQTPVEGIVHAKTGTLRGVRALSGYLDHREYGTLIFSIMANHPNNSGASLVRAIDEMVITLNMASPCQSAFDN